MRTLVPSPVLRRAFTVDGVVSGLIGAVQVADAAALAPLLGLPRALLLETGLFLVVFGLGVAVLARLPRLPSWLVGFVVAGSVAWVLGAVAIAAERLVAPTSAGMGWLAMHALVTAAMTAWTVAGWRASAASGAAAGAPVVRPNW